MRARSGPRRFAAVIAVALAAIVLVSCSTGDPRSVDVTLSDFKIELGTTSVPAGKVTFRITNEGPSNHEFVLFKTDVALSKLPKGDDGGIAESRGLTPLHAVEDIASGESPTLRIALDPGTYLLVCNHPGHLQKGMHRSFTVRGKTQGSTTTASAASGGEQRTTDTTGTTTATTVATYDYTTITGEMGVIQVDVPTVWTDIDGKSGSDGAQVVASPNIDAFYTGWSTPGVRIVTAPQSGPADLEEYLDSNSWAQDACTLKDGRQPYHDNIYTGLYDSYTDCGGTSTAMVVIAASPVDGSYEIFVTVKMVDDADRKALDQILATFKVTYPAAGGNARG